MMTSRARIRSSYHEKNTLRCWMARTAQRFICPDFCPKPKRRGVRFGVISCRSQVKVGCPLHARKLARLTLTGLPLDATAGQTGTRSFSGLAA